MIKSIYENQDDQLHRGDHKNKYNGTDIRYLETDQVPFLQKTESDTFSFYLKVRLVHIRKVLKIDE